MDLEEKSTEEGNNDTRLIWCDDFTVEGKVDASKWRFECGGHGWGNQELQCYTDSPSNARVEEGVLRIEARKEDTNGRSYSSARLVSKFSCMPPSPKRGVRVEVRAKLPSGRGTWPAIWMLPTEWRYGEWPKSGEIDIMECVGWDMDRIHASVHTGSFNHMRGTQKTSTTMIKDSSTNFHTYTLDWHTNWLTVSIDGDALFTFTHSQKDFNEWPFDQPFHLLLNIAVGGTWGGKHGVDDNIFPQQMQVETVKIFDIPTLHPFPPNHPLPSSSVSPVVLSSLQEKPVFIRSCTHKLYLGSTPNGNVDTTDVCEGWQQWHVINAGDGRVFLEAITHQRVLGSTPDRKVDTTDVREGWQHWELIPVSPTMTTASTSTAVSRCYVRSVCHGLYLGSTPERKVDTTDVKEEDRKSVV